MCLSLSYRGISHPLQGRECAPAVNRRGEEEERILVPIDQRMDGAREGNPTIDAQWQTLPLPFPFLQTRRKVGRKSGKENQGSTVVRREEERGGGRGFPSFIGTSFALFREGPLTYKGWKGRGAVPKEEGEGEQKKLWRGSRIRGFYCLEALQGEREGIQLCKREQ